MDDVFNYVLKEYLETKEKGWSPFELHIVKEKIIPETKISDFFKSYRCLLKRYNSNNDYNKKHYNKKHFYYDLIGKQDIDGVLSLTKPSLMKLQHIFYGYKGIINFGRNDECYAIILNRHTKKVVFCSGTLLPNKDRILYMKQFKNIFSKFDSLIIEPVFMEDIIKKRFEL
jgi:hypothetical protein